MLDKIQKRLGYPDRISTVWFLLTAPPFMVTYFYFVSISSKPHNSLITIGIMLIYCLNFYLLLKYAIHVDKKKKNH